MENSSDWLGAYDVVETAYTVGAVTVQIALRDPTRVMLMFAAVGGTVSLSTKNPPNTAQSLQVQTQTSLSLPWEWYGPLVNVDWWALSLGAAKLTVFEVFLRRPWLLSDKSRIFGVANGSAQRNLLGERDQRIKAAPAGVPWPLSRDNLPA